VLDSPGLPAPAIEVDQLHERGRYEELSIKCKSTNTLAARLRTVKETRQQSKENGGEPLIDPLFEQTHAYAWDRGMLIQISTNGSRLDQPPILDLLTTRRPYRLTLSLYGATEQSYDAMTRRRGSFKRFMRGLAAAHEAGLPIRLNIVVSNRNAHEIPQMRAIADRYGIRAAEFTNISPTIYGGGEVLPSQAHDMLRKRQPYTGCNAGITHFHADPHGQASICKIGRDPQVNLITEGADGLRRLAAIADTLLTRQGGCTGCALQKTCGTCMPLATLYRQASAPLELFCQHGHERR
jgi:MoaA/NifB/PqqE/SkfB family radical SAM enzyme